MRAWKGKGKQAGRDTRKGLGGKEGSVNRARAVDTAALQKSLLTMFQVLAGEVFHQTQVLRIIASGSKIRARALYSDHQAPPTKMAEHAKWENYFSSGAPPPWENGAASTHATRFLTSHVADSGSASKGKVCCDIGGGGGLDYTL